jgi:hypothetical protein
MEPQEDPNAKESQEHDACDPRLGIWNLDLFGG